MKNIITITSLLLMLYSSAHAQTFRPTYKHELKPYVQSTKLQSKEDLLTLELVCGNLGLMSVVNHAVKQYKSNKEVEKRLNYLQRLTQYLVGLKVKAEKFKKYFKVEF